MKEPLVSVIMPAFNAESYLAESVCSVLNQSYTKWELVIIDDGSTDRTADVAQALSSADSRIKCFSQPNGGQGRARNAGLSRATGEAVAFLDSDDLWLSDKLRLQVAALLENNADVVFSDGFIFQGDDAADETVTFGEANRLMLFGRLSGAEMFERLCVVNVIPVLSVLVRHAALKAVGNFNADRRFQNCEDYDLWLRLARDGASFYGMRERLVRYRRHAHAMTFSLLRQQKAELAVLENHARAERRLRQRKRQGALKRDEMHEGLAHQRIAELRRLVFAGHMDRFYSKIDAGDVAAALPSLWEAVRLSPSKMLHPRWLLTTLGGGVIKAFKQGKSSDVRH
jgi:teichuronic acid biosynthesis glycosyltransferase TuaG